VILTKTPSLVSLLLSASLIASTQQIGSAKPCQLDDRERRAKNSRFNGSGPSLLERRDDREYFPEYVWTRGVPVFPLAQSELVLVGEVEDIRSFLSKNQTRIYSEICIRVHELFKDSRNRVHNGYAMINQLGGTILISDGRTLRYEVDVEGLGPVRIGSRYAIFANKINKGRDLAILKMYELHSGHVFVPSPDGKPSTALLSTVPGIDLQLASEPVFLEELRKTKAAAKTANGAR
jgi:hypothetical protein